jgi:predicted anti-sigma-YlaC factor YlaD
MKCRRARALLHASEPQGSHAAASGGLRRHLAECGDCSRHSERLEELYRALGEHRASVSPATGFAARVRSRLPQQDDALGWAALRLLPATVGLVLFLSWLNWQQSAIADETIGDPTNAVLTWVLEPAIGENGS